VGKAHGSLTRAEMKKKLPRGGPCQFGRRREGESMGRGVLGNKATKKKLQPSRARFGVRREGGRKINSKSQWGGREKNNETKRNSIK